MDRDTIVKSFWNYYLMLEQKFIATLNYVELDSSNFNTFSNEYALLLQSVGAELDNFFKVYCGYNLTDRKNINDYVVFIINEYPDIVNQKIKVNGTDIELIPFDGWNVSSPAQSLDWWIAFDSIKHNRHGYFSNANQINVINILAALFLLEMKMIKRVAKEDSGGTLLEPDTPDISSKLFIIPDWNIRFVRLGDCFGMIDG